MSPHSTNPIGDDDGDSSSYASPAVVAPAAKPTPPSSSSSFLSLLPSHNLAPLWTVMSAMVPPLPMPRASVASWPYSSVRPLLLAAGDAVDAHEAERRVLMLVNPSMRAPFTTDTIYAGLQLIMPGETAPAHRHTAFALRFIVEGERGFTAVGGRKVRMRRGDVVVTPSWEWHDHGHEGEGPMIWLDGLDLPLYQSFPTNFAEAYAESRYPSEPVADHDAQDRRLRVGWDEVQRFLDRQPGSHAVYHYQSGGVAAADDDRQQQQQPLSKTIGGQAERLEAGRASPAVRESCSLVYHCVEGSGTTRLELADGREETVEWRRGDTFAVPAWTRRTHVAASGAAEEAGGASCCYLFAINDLPLLQNLGMYRRE